MTIHPSTTQQVLLDQLNKVIYLSTEWWALKNLIEKFNTTK